MTTRALTPDVNLYAQQMILEAGMTELGITRYGDKVESHRAGGTENETAYGSALIKSHLSALSTAIAGFIADATSGKAGRRHASVRYIADADPDVLAYLTLRCVTAALTQAAPIVRTTTMIGQMIEDEIRFSDARDVDRGLYHWLRKEVGKKGTYRVAHKVATVIGNRMSPEWESWGVRAQHQVGSKMLDLVLAHTNLVALDTVQDHTTRVRGKLQAIRKVLVPTPETLEEIEKRNDTASLMAPLYEPMIVPPAAWTQPQGGGYLSQFVRPLRVVKTRYRGYLDELGITDLTRTYAALNAAQETAWSVNPAILDVLSELWDIGSAEGNIPPRHDEDLPPRPFDIDANEDARKQWRGEAAKVHALNRENRSRRIQFRISVQTAEKYSRFDKLYFPYQMDFRGRIYAVPSFNPQGPDYMKALLQFSEGVPLGSDGWTWLAVQLANTGAFDKMDKQPLATRIQWVLDNHDAILACARDPYTNRWWSEADSPFQFLAACFEWASLAEWEAAGNVPSEFLSHLPVALDGSCSGIQHFSIAFRDEIGGRAVNLVPTDQPADIYTLVADKVREACEAYVADDQADEACRDHATQWLSFGITRSLCKRPTMTFGYGSRQFGFRDQVSTDTLYPAYRKHLSEGAHWPFEGDGYKASLFMARLIAEAVGQVVVKAAEAMDWLQAMAKVVAAEDLPVRWTVPDGFPVLQGYREVKSRTVKTFMAGSVIKVSLSEEGDKVDRRAQAQAIAPNYIHSLDACHLRMVVSTAAAEGMDAFALVHDSFGVHAGHTGRFFMLIREAFVEMYQDNDVIGGLIAELKEQVDPKRHTKLPPPPTTGALDIEAILDSDYCFA